MMWAPGTYLQSHVNYMCYADKSDDVLILLVTHGLAICTFCQVVTLKPELKLCKYMVMLITFSIFWYKSGPRYWRYMAFFRVDKVETFK